MRKQIAGPLLLLMSACSSSSPPGNTTTKRAGPSLADAVSACGKYVPHDEQEVSAIFLDKDMRALVFNDTLPGTPVVLNYLKLPTEESRKAVLDNTEALLGLGRGSSCLVFGRGPWDAARLAAESKARALQRAGQTYYLPHLNKDYPSRAPGGNDPRDPCFWVPEPRVLAVGRRMDMERLIDAYSAGKVGPKPAGLIDVLMQVPPGTLATNVAIGGGARKNAVVVVGPDLVPSRSVTRVCRHKKSFRATRTLRFANPQVARKAYDTLADEYKGLKATLDAGELSDDEVLFGLEGSSRAVTAREFVLQLAASHRLRVEGSQVEQSAEFSDIASAMFFLAPPFTDK